MTNGLVAVQAFFILSGFYMTLVLCEKYNDIKQFYWNRASRIFSGYWLALPIAIIFGQLAGQDLISAIVCSNWDFETKLMLVANVFIVGSDAMMFVYPGTSGLTFTANFQDHAVKLYQYHYLAAAWSLPVEFLFYLLAPFVARSVPKLVALASISLLIRLLTYAIFGEKDPWTYRFFPNELLLFMAGALSYHVTRYMTRFKLPNYAGNSAFILLIICIVFYKFIFDNLTWPFYLLLLAAIPFIFLHNGGISSRFDQAAGEIAYMVYLVHMIVLNNVPALTGIKITPFITIVLTIIISTPLHALAKIIDHRMRSARRILFQNGAIEN